MSATDTIRIGEEREPAFGFWRRSYAMLVKEFIQLRRDRVSFAMIIIIPVMQLLLFGYAINTTPRHLPTAVLLQEDTDLGRSILKAMENTAYFRFTREVHTVEQLDELLQSGKVLFGVEIPRGFERAVRRGDKPALLVAADATDPVAAGSALGALGLTSLELIAPPAPRAAVLCRSVEQSGLPVSAGSAESGTRGRSTPFGRRPRSCRSSSGVRRRGRAEATRAVAARR